MFLQILQLCFREPRSQDYYRRHSFFPPFSSWIPIFFHRLGQYPHQNPGSSRGAWMRRLYIWDDCVFPAAPHSQGEITWSHPLSSGVTESLPHLLDSLPEDRLTTSWGFENLLSVEGLFTCWERKSSSWNPTPSPGVFMEGPEFPVVTPVLLAHVSGCPESVVLRRWALVCLCKWTEELSSCHYFTFSREIILILPSVGCIIQLS